MVEPIKVVLVQKEEERLRRFLRDKVVSIREGLADLHTTKVTTWRKAYEAIPALSVRNFPFKNSSNLVVPIIAIHSDTLLARVMASIFKTQPLWVTQIIGDHENPGEYEKMRDAMERWLQYVAIEPTQLDLYRVCHEWFGEAIRLGTSTVKTPWIRSFEEHVTTSADGLGRTEVFKKLRYEGNKPNKIPFVDFGLPPASRTVEDARFKYHRIRYQRDELEERAYMGIYDRAAVRSILDKPDRTSPDYGQQQLEQDTGAHTQVTYGFAEYDVYECHFTWRFNQSHYCKMVAWYNEHNDKILRVFHQYYPEEVFVTARLFYRDDFFFGYGFAETLASMQEEISTIHNQRRDNSTIANCVLTRVDPDSELRRGYEIFPGAQVPARKDEIEPFPLGQVNPMAIDEEQLTLELAEKRSGVSAPIQGAGSGAMTKRGVYSSMGTLSLLQEGNTRTDLNITDIRYAWTKLGRIITKHEAEFGSDDMSRYASFGKMGRYVQQALQKYRDGLLTLPVYPATASVNREVEKQSDLMLSGLMQKHHQMIGQMLQAASNQFSPPEMKDYLLKAIDAANTLMRQVFRHFGYDEVERYVPDANVPAGGAQPQGQPQGGQPQAGPPQLPGMVGGPPSLTAASQVPTGTGPFRPTSGNPLAAILESGAMKQ